MLPGRCASGLWLLLAMWLSGCCRSRHDAVRLLLGYQRCFSNDLEMEAVDQTAQPNPTKSQALYLMIKSLYQCEVRGIPSSWLPKSDDCLAECEVFGRLTA